MSTDGLVIESVGGYCPCQAEGTMNGNPFYFRARHGYWTLCVVEPGSDPVCWMGDSPPVLYEAAGTDEDMGYMEPGTASALLRAHYGIFSAKAKP